MDEYMLYSSVAETAGVYHEFLTPKEIKDRWPLVRTEDLVGALFHPQDGYINPADVTQAMAKGARQLGAQFERKVQVDGYRWTGSEWVVSCTRMADVGGRLVPTDDRFEVIAEHVVTATGNHAQRTARMLGIKTHAIPVEHQYIVTEPDPALVEWRKTNPQHPVLRDADAKWYVREERGGWILARMRLAPRPASPTACRKASAPTCSRWIWSGSSRSTCRSSTAFHLRKRSA